MIISGNLVTPLGDSMANAQIKLTASRTSSSLLKLTSREFTTDEQGFYSIDVPVGRYHVERYDDKLRGWLSVGVLEITNTTEISDLSTLLMVEETQVHRDSILSSIEGMVVEAQNAASQASNAVSGIDATVEAAINTALENYEFPAGVNGQDGISPIFSIGTVEVGDTTSATITGTQANPILNLTIERGPSGVQGIEGAQGPAGPKGDNGKSAYAVSVSSGFIGTEIEWLASLKGDKGDPGEQGLQGPKGDKGETGAQGDIGPEGPAPDTSEFATKTEINSLIKTQQVTQAQYDAIGVKNPNVLYVVVG